ncbi:PREDICTED: U3 small nucleolar RNA-associated protein 20-like [Camelina sativa]|uniref:U3 small nucleolar RNA-associated protein 20-like n=1 Tax=Camelina sativa TaxID=90675 RepID=A0ABM0T9X8_CAMSA|nr:PREDICTED: U3 small nucleolar RNA-associated protein 20-like [Camelina sativa]
MATAADSRAVKSHSNSEGRKRFMFKNFAERVNEIESKVLKVFRSLHKVKDEPSQGSTYLKDCLVEFRELNTAADFISFYEEMLPCVQTLPLVVLHQDLIFSKLVSGLHIKARFSLEAFLWLIYALSRDLLDGFLPFLPRLVNSIVTLLKNGGQKEPDILEQIFVSWSHIVRDLQKYLICDIEGILRDTLELRYYPGEHIFKLMSPSISFLLRTARDEQLEIGIKRILSEIAYPLKKCGGDSILYHVMRGTSEHLHSKAGKVLSFLLKDSTLSLGVQFPQGSCSIVEALSSTLQRICKDFKAEELFVMWNCLYEETKESIKNKATAHLSRLLTLLTSVVRVEKGLKVYDYPYLVELVSQIVPTFMDSSAVLDKVMGLMLCTIDSPSAANEMESIASQWAPIFSVNCSSLLNFLRELLGKDKLVLKAFSSNILRSINNMILVSPEEVIPLLLSLCESEPTSHDKVNIIDESFESKFERIHEFLEEKIKKIQTNIENIGLAQTEEAELAAAFGAIKCFPYFKVDPSLLICFKNTLIQHLSVSVVNTFSAPELMWQSLLGAALRSCHKFSSSGRLIDSDLEEALSLAKSYKSCVQVLSPVTDYLDFVYRPLLAKNDLSKACPELQANIAEDAFDIFSENLCHSKKDVRLVTLRILCHFETLYPNPSFEEHPPMKKLKTEVIQKSSPESNNVLQLLKAIEESHLTVSTERELVKGINTIQNYLSAGRIHDTYVPLVFKGMIGLFYNQFSEIWEPVSECLAVLMKKHTGAVWNDFVHYLGQCQLKLEALDSHSENENDSISQMHTVLIERFNSSDTIRSTPTGKVVSLLLKTLQKIPSVAQSRVSDLLPLLLKFLGYNSENPLRVGLYNGGACKGEEWKGLLIQWLTLLKLMKNPRSCCFSQFVNDVMENRFLDHNDAEIQMSVLECLVLWNDYLLPHRHRLENLIKPKELREELATWNFSMDIEEAHRCHFVSLVIRILMPKVRNLKTSASRKHTSIRHREAVLGLISQLDVNELSLFFALLMKPLNIISEDTMDLFWSSGKSSLDYFQKSNFLKSINADAISTLSWKKKFGFLHVIQHILEVFDVLHVRPFLDFLMGCAVRLLITYDPNIDEEKSIDKESVSTYHDQAGSSLKQFKELRSLCLKIIARVLEKYTDCDLGSEFWDLFFSAVNSLIKSFKQEGSSSEKPSSLFSCFLSMSKSRSLVTLLCREESLVPDIFSIITVTTASEAIKSSALSFIENLLCLESDLDDHEDDDHMIKGFLDPYIEALINSLHSLFRWDSLKRKTFKYHGEREIKILKLLSKHIGDESNVMEYLDILLSFLDKRVKDSDIHREALVAIKDITSFIGSESTSKIIDTISPLLVDAAPDVRLCICDLFESLAKIDLSLDLMAKCVSDMNATSPMEVDDLDYETIIKAYAKIDADFFTKSSEQQMMIILSQSLYNISSSEVTLKDCAFNLLCTFIKFSASILCQEASAHSDNGKEVSKFDASWTGDRVLWIINKFILKHIGDALNRGISSGKEEILLIRKMVTKLPDSGNLAAFGPLCSENDDVDFFKNVLSIQIYRRKKAINRFSKEIKDSSLPEGVVRKLLVSVFFNMLLDGEGKKGQDRKGQNRKGQDKNVQNLQDACAEALASVSAHMSWCSYYALLNRCFREMKTHTEDKRKRLLNLVCSILDKFHFAKDGHEQEVRTCLEKTLLPKIQKLMDSESDSVTLRSYVAAVKVLKLLPKEIMDSNLDSLVYKISKFLRHREDRTRDEARKVLAACLKELGLEGYFQLFLQKLVSLLKKGSEVHVLGYTVNSILSECLPNPTGWMLDHCLENLLDVVEADILGDIDEHKEDRKYSLKTKKETKTRKSLATLKLIAENVTFRSHALKLLSLVTRQLQRPMTSNLKSKLEDTLKHIAFGIEGNPSVDQGDLFCFIYHRVEDGINNRSCLGDQASSLPSKKKRKSRHLQETCGGKSCPHLITVFALDLLDNRLKKIQPSNTNEELVSKLDPFVKLLVGCLSSKYEDVVSSSVSCFTALINLPLPSLKSEAGKVITITAESAVSSSSHLVQSGKKLLKAVLGNEKFIFSSEELNMLIQLPMFVDLESDPSVDSLNASLSLLKAIVKRKVPKIYDAADQVSKLMITHKDESVCKKCKELLIDFLVNHTLSKKRLEGHFNFLLKNLSYEHSSGREVVLEVLEDLIKKFSQPKLGKQSVLDQQSQILFVELTRRLATDDAKDSLSKICDLMELLIGRTSNYKFCLELCLGWYKQENTQATAAQVLGFFIEVRKEAFSEQIQSILLQEAKPILESAVQLQNNTVEEGSIPFWKEAYYSLVMIEKMLKQFPGLCFEKHLEDVWKWVFKLLLHPHKWLQIITCRLLNYYFKKLAESRKTVADSLLGKPSSLFMVAASLCFQLKMNAIAEEGNDQNNDPTEEDIVIQNIVFAVSGLHLRIGQSDHEYWSSLDKDEQAEFLEAFVLYDSGKVRSTFLALISGSEKCQDDVRKVLIGSLLKRMGKLALDMGVIHTRIVRIVLSVYKEFASKLSQEDCRLYAYRILFPLYKVCQGFTGKVISGELKQLAEEVRYSIRDERLGSQVFVQVYSEIKKSLEAKREKRKREEKLMAVINPERNAKRKLKLASKNKANKKRRIISSKMERWSRC